MKKLLVDLDENGAYLKEHFLSSPLFFVPRGQGGWAKEVYSLAIFCYLKGYDWIIIPSDQNFSHDSLERMSNYIDSVSDEILRIFDSKCMAISSKIAMLESPLIESCYVEDLSKIEFKNGNIIPTILISQMKNKRPEN